MTAAKKTARQELVKGIAAAAVLLALILVVPAIWLIVAFNHEFRQCVKLKNGLNLGYEAVFDLDGPLFEPAVVPRFANGTPVIREELWELFFTDTTLYGTTEGSESGGGYRFAWRADTGLILRRQNSAMYDGLVAEAGHPNLDIDIDSIDAGALFYRLAQRPEFKGQRCPTALITW